VLDCGDEFLHAWLMEEPRLFMTYVDELKLIGPSRFASTISCPMMLVRSLEAVEEGEEAGFDTKITHREDVGQVSQRSERPSDRPPGPRIGPGQVLRVVKRHGAAFQDRIGIGRAPNVDVRLPIAQVSKYHAYVSRDGDTWLLTDADSSNGTMVRGVPLEPRVSVLLEDTAEISFGACRLRFYTPDGFVRFVTSRAR
jgi:hypothetical protein